MVYVFNLWTTCRWLVLIQRPHEPLLRATHRHSSCYHSVTIIVNKLRYILAPRIRGSGDPEFPPGITGSWWYSMSCNMHVQMSYLAIFGTDLRSYRNKDSIKYLYSDKIRLLGSFKGVVKINFLLGIFPSFTLNKTFFYILNHFQFLNLKIKKKNKKICRDGERLLQTDRLYSWLFVNIKLRLIIINIFSILESWI